MRSKEEIEEKLTALQKENSDAEAKRDPVTDPCQSWQIERGATSSSRLCGRLDSISLFFSYEQIMANLKRKPAHGVDIGACAGGHVTKDQQSRIIKAMEGAPRPLLFSYTVWLQQVVFSCVYTPLPIRSSPECDAW